MLYRLCSAILLLVAGSVLRANPPVKSTPQLDSTPVGASSSVAFSGVKYVNKGLVGVGVVSASTRDERGDTLGSFSSFKVDPLTWHRNADGSYAGVLYVLPDRGYNVAGLVDYAARLQRFEIVFTPDYTTHAVGQTQLKLNFKGTTVFTDFNGNVTTGLNPTSDALGDRPHLPTHKGKLTVDAEGLALRSDGTFYVSEEYGCTIYHFDRAGKMMGLITPVPALLPKFTDDSGFSGFTTEHHATKSQTGGRRANQGLEALDVTPDGHHLVAMLQSATHQDTIGNQDFNRAYTRLFVYNISKDSTPAKPAGHYLVELPVVNGKGKGGAPNKTAAQSELVALSSHTFLVLTRDSNGNGSGRSDYDAGAAATGYAHHPHVYKNVALVDITGATNLAGTVYESTYAPAVRGGTTAAVPLDLSPVSGIVAAKTIDFVNLLNIRQLARFGLNLNVLGESGASAARAAGHAVKAMDENSLAEKWEALCLVPCLDPASPDDYFLLVGNDNDFVTHDGMMVGAAYDGIIKTPGAETVENHNRVLVYRVTLPGYTARLEAGSRGK